MLFPFRKRKDLNIQIVDAEFEENDEDSDEDEEDYEEPDPDAMQEQVYAWGAEWAKTPAFEALTEEQKDHSEGITANFTQYMYSYHDVTPEQWNVADMQECCLETLPRKVSAEESYFRSMAPVLASFFLFLGETNRLSDAAAMAKRVLQLDKRIVAASNNPRYWGPAKSLVMAAMVKGVDLEDDAQMQAFVGEYNAEIMGQPALGEDLYGADVWDEEDAQPDVPYVREGPKVGRNDPCPCGSGKKYKKCCGAGV